MPARSHSWILYAAAACTAVIVSVLLSTRAGLALTSSVRALVRPWAGALSSWAQDREERSVGREIMAHEQVRLQNEVERLTREVRDLAVCQEENSDLKQLVRYLPPPGFFTVSARILAPVNAEKTQVLVDKGSAHGVMHGSAAVSGEGIVWGRVTNVEDEFSVVSLLSDPALAIPARVVGSVHDGILKRDEQGSLILDLLPLTASVDQNTMVLTAGLDDRIPPNLVLGRIINASRKEHAPFLRVEVAPAPVALRTFIYVVVRSRAE